MTKSPDTKTPAASASAPAARTPPVVSPEIHPDNTVTFRLRAPSASTVRMWGDWDGKPNDMTKDVEGVWSITLGPIAPSVYAYSFNLDGLTLADPQNNLLKPMRTPTSSVLAIPGVPPVPLFYQPGVPRGTIHLEDYESKALATNRRLMVYTPPGYDPRAARRYPVLYLFHGSGDNEATWSEFGKANVIIDNLIAAGKAQPMIIVMTDGHAFSRGAARVYTQGTENFAKDFLGDVMPLVESRYLISPERARRAIVGLSMGGNQSLTIGLNHRELFSWVGGMSSAIRQPERDLAEFWKDPVSEKWPLHLLWLRIGRDDYLLKENQHFAALLTEKKVPHDYAESAGGHIWPNWRAYLTELAPLLFQKPSSAPARSGE